MTEYISLLRKTEYKLETEKMQKQFNFMQVKENSPNILISFKKYPFM